MIGAGSLAYYGLGLSQAPGAVDKALAWPQHVRDRIRNTYSYLLASVGVTAATTMAILRVPVVTFATVHFYQTGGFLALVATMVVLLFTKGQIQSIPYSSEMSRKHTVVNLLLFDFCLPSACQDPWQCRCSLAQGAWQLPFQQLQHAPPRINSWP